MRIYLRAYASPRTLETTMHTLGVDPGGITLMRDKGAFLTLQIKDISGLAANILKQEMLSRGGDVAVPRGALYGSKKSTDIVVFGTRRQFNDLLPKLLLQPFGLKELSRQLQALFTTIDKPTTTIRIGPKTFNMAKRTLCMGILNVTPDSFSDGGKFFSPDTAVIHARQMVKDGADIIDIGAESSRPGAREINSTEELKRLLPVIKALRTQTKALISVDTTKASVAKACLKAGAHMINDISGLLADKQMAKVIAAAQVPVVIMHRSGRSTVMQKRTTYTDVVTDIIDTLQKSIEIALAAGIERKNILVDPGLGFGKTVEQNLEMIKRLPEFKTLGCPMLIGASRKSFIGAVLKTDVSERLEGTLALTAEAIQGGASIIRVHDVKENIRVLRMCDAIRSVSDK